jgi:hypothetical protein
VVLSLPLRHRGRTATRFRRGRVPLLAIAALVAVAAPARADWHLAPFAGVKFGGTTTLVDLDEAAGKTKFAYGGTVTWIGRGIVGVEGDVGFVSNYFENGKSSSAVTKSYVATAMGNVVVTAPLGWTRDSLRPYVSGGLGLVRARMDDSLNVFSFRRTMGGYNAGGGVVGFIMPFTGVKWDLRYFKAWGPAGEGTTFGSARLSFWRGTMSLVLKY